MDTGETVNIELGVKRSQENSDNGSLEPDLKKSKVDDSEAVCDGKEESREVEMGTGDDQTTNNTPSPDRKSENDKQKVETVSECDNGNSNSGAISDVKGDAVNSVSEDKTQDNGTETSKSSPELKGPATELDVGITEYLGTHTKSFTAIIKQRYSDFIVNEIDLDGNVVHLTKVTHDDKEDVEEEEEKMIEGADSVLSEDDRKAIQKIVTDRNRDASHDIKAPEDKDLRTKIHLAVKQSFSQLETRTEDDDRGNKVIKVMFRKGKTRDQIRDEWPKSKKSCRYVKFVLYKENKDTMDAIGLIAKNLRVRESMFQYAGTKDKRAKTSQEITAHRIHPKKLVGLNKVLWNMGLGDFRYVQEPLQLGQLSGNRFVIVLRNVQGSQEVVDSALTSLKDTGFINYFGMQRFGTTSIPTHDIGSALLKGDYDKAIDLILAPRNDVPAKDKFQKKWAETRDPAATLDLTPRFCNLERNILEGLMKRHKSFNALEKLPRNARLLYLHSYQSLVWNKMASKRLTQLGHDVVTGDLVMETKGGATSPIVVTEENAGSYKLTDVVLPLPGHDVIYPNNPVGGWYREVMTSDGLDIDNMKRPQKDYSLPGAYRHLIVIPKDVSWTHHSYNDYTKPLTLSDLDLIQENTLEDDGETGKMSAVVLKISLPTSCYATMALREATRVDTSSFHQASLNAAD